LQATQNSILKTAFMLTL